MLDVSEHQPGSDLKNTLLCNRDKETHSQPESAVGSKRNVEVATVELTHMKRTRFLNRLRPYQKQKLTRSLFASFAQPFILLFHPAMLWVRLIFTVHIVHGLITLNSSFSSVINHRLVQLHCHCCGNSFFWTTFILR